MSSALLKATFILWLHITQSLEIWPVVLVIIYQLMSERLCNFNSDLFLMTIIILLPPYILLRVYSIRKDFSAPGDLKSNEKVILEVTLQSNVTMIIQGECNCKTHFFFISWLTCLLPIYFILSISGKSLTFKVFFSFIQVCLWAVRRKLEHLW